MVPAGRGGEIWREDRTSLYLPRITNDQPTLRQRLALRLEGFPLLRTLVLDPAFSWAFLLAVALAGGIALAVPKVWRMTPAEFSRATVRVSLIDLVQAWSLSRSARQADAAGLHDQALQAWRGAVINNLADPGIHRGLLGHLLQVPEARPENLLLSLFSSSWLLALTGTNAVDLALTAEVLEKYRVPDLALEWLDTAPSAGQADLARVRARCLLSAGKAEGFADLWKAHREAWQGEAAMAVYHDAWQAGWDTGSPAIEAMARLRESTRRPGRDGLTAARLLLLAAVRRGGPEDVEHAIRRLAEGRADSVDQHALHWRFLASLGRFDEARNLALEFSRVHGASLRLANDCAEYALILAAFGLRDEAVEFLRANLGRFESNPFVWEAYLAILADARRWSELRRASAQVRTQTASFETARILAIFAEYRAEVAEGNVTRADRLAAELAEARILDNATAQRIAGELVADRRPGPALAILRAKRPELRDSPPFWQGMFAAAMHLKDVEGLTESTTELLRLRPEDPVALSNRAAMYIVLGEQPTEALEITFRLVTAFPQAAAFRINHAFALLLNRRTDEAWETLRQMDASRLDRHAASAYHLALTELLTARGQFAEALETADKVQPGMILPPQQERLAQLRATCAARLKG